MMGITLFTEKNAADDSLHGDTHDICERQATAFSDVAQPAFNQGSLSSQWFERSIATVASMHSIGMLHKLPVGDEGLYCDQQWDPLLTADT